MDELQCLLIDNNLDIIKTIYKINHYDYSNKDIIYDIKENYNKINNCIKKRGSYNDFMLIQEQVYQINKLKGESDKEKIIDLLENIIERQNNFRNELYEKNINDISDYDSLLVETYFNIENILYESYSNMLYYENDYINDLIDNTYAVYEAAPVKTVVKGAGKAGKAVVKGSMKVWQQLLGLVSKIRELFMSKLKKIQERDKAWLKDNKKALMELNPESLEIRIHSDYNRTLNQSSTTLNSFKQVINANLKTTDYNVFKSKLNGYVDKNGDLKIGLSNKFRTGDSNKEYEIKVMRGNDIKNVISPLITFCEAFINSVGDINKKLNEEANFIKSLEREMKNRDITMENYCYIEEMYYNETDLALYYDFDTILEQDENNNQTEVKTGANDNQQKNDTKPNQQNKNNDKVGVQNRNETKEKTDRMTDNQLSVYTKICKDNHMGVTTYLTTMEKKYFESITILRGLVK